MKIISKPRRAAFAAAGLTGAIILAGLAPLPAVAADPATPDFGPNVKIFDPATPVGEINSYLASIAGEREFSSNRHAVFFKPGTYGSAAGQNDPSTATGIVNTQLGYYTSVAGLGESPESVVINGAVHVDGGGALTKFWRSLSNVTINPIQRPVGQDTSTPSVGAAAPHTMNWIVSQATPLRRVNILGNLDLTGVPQNGAFGSVIANSRITGSVISGDVNAGSAQAQWYTRDSEIGNWNGTAVNLVFSGVDGAPASNFATGGTTNLPATPASREAPHLFIDKKGEYQVFVPSVEYQSSGTHWATNGDAGRTVAIDKFFIAKPTDSAAVINTKLASGKNLILTPGVYALEAPINVTRKDTVIMGMGYASLAPAPGTSAIQVSDVDGVVISAITVDANTGTDVLIKVGTKDEKPNSNLNNPTTLSDVFVRVGGPRNGQVKTAIEVNSDNVILDYNWIWRADHGTGAGWTSNLADTGLVVNGDNVTATGLMVEHFQKNQVIWNGEKGRTVYYQSEFPYDPPTQAAWMNGAKEGYASYVVSPGVKSHDATGLAIYGLFFGGLFGPAHVQIQASSGIEAPVEESVNFTSMATAIIVAGGIKHVINDTGDGVQAATPNGAFGMTSATRLATFN